MPRNMSFALTTQQFIDQTKFVTRRWGWFMLLDKPPGVILCGVEKAMGLKKGECVNRLGDIEVISSRLEPLRKIIDDPEYGAEELRLEGYPLGIKDPEEFCNMLLESGRNKRLDSMINRIEYIYI